MTNRRRVFFHVYACATSAQAFAFMIALSAASWALSPSNVWYTQIGQWHLVQKDSLSGTSFLFHDSRIDGALSGQATANVRLNLAIQDIRRCEARLSLGPAPATAGLLVQNKQVTYYFLAKKGTGFDSLRICRFRDNSMILLLGAKTTASDTTRLTLSITADSLCCGADTAVLSVAKPSDFPNPAFIGFECPQGSVKVFDMHVEAKNSTVKEPFDKATLVNLHLDKMLLHGGK
jgi:hypothetical protein